MAVRKIKCSLARDGRLFVVDPGFDCLPLIIKIQPEFSIQSLPPPPDFVPFFQRSRRTFVPGLDAEMLRSLDEERLWGLHDRAIKEGAAGREDAKAVSILDLKIELARRELRHCGFCGWQCGANRFEGKGRCGLGPDACYDEPFVHIAEEAVITPAATVRLTGCSLKCVFCQARDEYLPRPLKRLDAELWAVLASDEYFPEAASLEFGGGNPDESAYAILEALGAAPASFRLPVVMNDNGYARQGLYRLLDGVVDVWLTDFKYWSEECGERVSGVRNYPETARKGIEAIASQQAKAIIRHLVLPGHFACCSEKILGFLAQYKERIWVSIIENYVPDWRAKEHPTIDRMVSEDEVRRVRELAEFHKLRDVSEFPEEFWKGE